MYNFNKFACNPKLSRGRFFKEKESPFRTCYQRDRDRIIHSIAFRRLKHKTQVFVEHEGDHYRTRLTHSLEVSQVARTIANVLKINSDLTEAIALAHDLGHTPFGHTGEDSLSNCMKNYGGFNHNTQSFRIVSILEKSYAEFTGLNLTWETIEGIVKHDGPLDNREKRNYQFFERISELDLESFPSLEAQVASISDDIAYNSHDLDDGLRADLFNFEDVIKLPLLDEAFSQISLKYPNESTTIKQKETLRLFLNNLVIDVIKQTQENLKENFNSSFDTLRVSDIRNYGAKLVEFSPDYFKKLQSIKDFLYKRMYRHEKVNLLRRRAKIIVNDLFDILIDNNDFMTEPWSDLIKNTTNTSSRYRLVADYLSGMTDRYAIQEHSRLTGKQIFP